MRGGGPSDRAARRLGQTPLRVALRSALTLALALALGSGACGQARDGREPPANGAVARTDSGAGPDAGAGTEPGATTVHGRAPASTGGIPAIVTLTPVEPATGDESSAVDSGAPPATHGSVARPTTPHPAAPAVGEDAVVDQFGLAFSPRVLVAKAGAPVRFTNSEGAITHNVHLRSVAGDSTVFNGDTGPTEGVDVELPGPGGYDVLCDMHPGMTGFVFVTEAPYAVAAGTDGSFEVAGLPPGDYAVRVWTADSGFGGERRVTVSAERAELDLTAAR